MGCVIGSPVAYRVFQRNAGNVARVPVCAEVDGSARRVEARVVDDGGAAAGWTAMEASGEGRFSREMEVPAGGWYEVQVRALDAGGELIGEASVGKVGVGEVFICAGQSNAGNSGAGLMSSQDDRAASFDGENWTHCDDPQKGATGQGGSPWPVLGDLLVRGLGVPVAFASVAVGGSSVKYWQPGEPGYPRLEHAVNALGPHGARAVLWHQGETDAMNGMPADEHEGLLANVIKLSREVGRYEIPWVVANVSFCPERWDQEPEKRDAIRSAQQALWSKGMALRGPDTDELRDPKYRAADRIHFSELGLKEHGRAWYEAVMEQLFA